MILITGAAGFIGNALASSFAGRDDVVLTDVAEPRDAHGLPFIWADLRDRDSCHDLPDADIVFHMAAHNNTSHFYDRPLTVINNTMLTTLNLVNRYIRTRLFVYASSSEIYAGLVNSGTVPLPTPEVNSSLIEAIDNPRWSYAGSKLLGEQMVHSAHLQHGMGYLILRYHNVYGPGQKGHFIPEYADKLRSGDNELRGTDQTRSFIYIDDAVHITRRLCDLASNTTVNVGNPTEHTIGEVAAMIRGIMGVDSNPIELPAPIGSVSRRCADVSRMMSYVGDHSFISISNGLRRTLGYAA